MIKEEHLNISSSESKSFKTAKKDFTQDANIPRTSRQG